MSNQNEAVRVRTQVLNFLVTDPHISKINFRLGRYKIYPSGYRDVWRAIFRNDIEVKIDSDLLTSSAEAKYSDDFWPFLDDDRLCFRPGINLSQFTAKRTVIHECTHALIDIQRIGDNQQHGNEATAYLAAGFWAASAKITLKTQTPNLMGTNDKLRRIAQEIAGNMLLSKKYDVPTGEISRLRSAIASTPIYRKNKTMHSDGV